MIIQSPQNQSVCEGGTVNFTCVVMFPSGTTPGSANWATNNGQSNAASWPGHTITSDLIGFSVPVNVTNVLTVTNVDSSNNGRDYVCVQGLVNPVISNTAFLTVNGNVN